MSPPFQSILLQVKILLWKELISLNVWSCWVLGWETCPGWNTKHHICSDLCKYYSFSSRLWRKKTKNTCHEPFIPRQIIIIMFFLFRGMHECFLLKVRHVCITTNVLTKDTDSSYLLSASQHVGAEEAKNKQICQFSHTWLVTRAAVIFRSQCRFDALHTILALSEILLLMWLQCSTEEGLFCRT